jgi:toxin ParE1/3/4
MKSVGFHPEAKAELRESVRYYEAQQAGLGKHFLAAVRAAKERIESYPLMYRMLEKDIRQCRVLRFPYGLIYRPRETEIQIVAVMHLHRKPGYWKNRL